MAFSNYPHGFKNGVTIRGVPVEMSHPGKVFWVGNNATRLDNEATASDGNDGTFLRPFATVMGGYANTAVAASRGDLMFIRPGYTENVSSATLWTLNKVGVALVGLGAGSTRPTITLTGATATITVSANDNSIRNFVFIANADDVAALFSLTTAKNFAVEDCLTQDTSSSLNLLVFIDTNATDNAADGLYVARNVWTPTKATASTLVKVDGIIDRLTVIDNFVRTVGTSTTVGMVAIALGADSITNALIARNYYRVNSAFSAGALVSSAGASSASYGLVAENVVQSSAVSTSLVVNAANVGLVQKLNYQDKSAGSVSARQVPTAQAVD